LAKHEVRVPTSSNIKKVVAEQARQEQPATLPSVKVEDGKPRDTLVSRSTSRVKTLCTINEITHMSQSLVDACTSRAADIPKVKQGRGIVLDFYIKGVITGQEAVKSSLVASVAESILRWMPNQFPEEYYSWYCR
jgi:hypothetical protein